MRAAYLTEYGDPDVIRVADIDDPLVGPDVVLVEMAAAGVNPVDWKIVAGYLRGAFPHHTPLIPGWDVAGVVRAVGPAVTSVAVGDRVAAYARKDDIQWGTFAELVAVPERAVAVVPDTVDIVHAGALPLAGLTAEQLLDAAAVGPGDTVLIHAATGGVGSFATQLAVARGAQVLGTASAGNHDVLRAWGAQPIDYTTDVAAQVRAVSPGGVSVIVDLVGGEALDTVAAVMSPGGRLTGVVDAARMAEIGAELGIAQRYVFVRPNAAQLSRLLGRVGAGDLVVDVAETYPLTQTSTALEQNRSGHTRGKIVILSK